MKIRKIRLFLIIIWLLIAGLIVWLKVLPLGQVTYSKNYLNDFRLLGGKGFISLLTPVDRLIKNSKSQVVGDPVYFSIFTPRTFNEVKLTITYKPTLSSKTPIIETGVLVDKIAWRYKMAPLQNNIIDNLSNWTPLKSDNILVLQRKNIFKDTISALKSFSGAPDVAWYNTPELSEAAATQKYETVAPFQIIDTPLRGTHQFYFVGNNKMSKEIHLLFSDLNLNAEDDNIDIGIYDGSSKIYSNKITDQFNDKDNATLRTLDFAFKVPELGLENKLYKLEIKAGDDVIINKILSAPSALNAVSRLQLATATNKSLSFWTNSSFLQVTATDPAGNQTINFDGQNFKIAEAYQQFELNSDNQNLKEIKIVKADLILENGSLFSFSKNSLLDINQQQIDRHFLLDDKVNFIVANYTTPKVLEDGWRQATVTLNTKDAYREKGKYSFIISVPGLSLTKDGSVEIASIKAEFIGRNLFDKLKEIFQTYVY